MADVAVGEGGVGAGEEPRRRPLSAPVKWLTAAIAAEGERRVLWLPVCLGVGIALYFTLTVEPPLWIGPTALALPALTTLVLRRWPALAAAALALTFAAAGL